MFKPIELRTVMDQAGAMVAAVSRAGSLNLRRKSDGSPITEVDRQVNEFLRAALRQLVPGSAWLSEEDVSDPARLAAEYCWVVDPLDGTTEFVSGRPEYAVSVALVRDAAPVAAAIINPATGESAAWVVGHELVVWGWTPRSRRALPSTLNNARVVISRGEIDRGTARAVAQRLPNLSVIGSAAYKLLRVAVGMDDLYVSMEPKSEWDVCAGVGLLNAAGMTYRLFSGEPVRFNQPETRIHSGAVAGRAPLVDAFLQTLRQENL